MTGHYAIRKHRPNRRLQKRYRRRRATRALIRDKIEELSGLSPLETMLSLREKSGKSDLTLSNRTLLVFLENKE